MLTAKERKQVLWSVIVIIGFGLVYTQTCTDRIDSGMKYANTSDVQKDFAKKITETVKGSVIDEATGYAVCGPGVEHVLREPVVAFKLSKMLPKYNHHVLKKSIARRLQAADEYCVKEKKVHIIVYSTLRSNIHQLESQIKRRESWFKIFRSPVGNYCGSGHNAGQEFDVLNFVDSIECLQKEGFHCGWEGIAKDPHHCWDPDLSFRKLPQTTWEKEKRTKVNQAWCLSNAGCRRNNKIIR